MPAGYDTRRYFFVGFGGSVPVQVQDSPNQPASATVSASSSAGTEE